MARHQLMAASVRGAAVGAGLSQVAVDSVVRAYTVAMAPRVEAIEDDHDSRYLHPGRTVLVLLQDVGRLAGRTLSAAAVHDSEDADLRVGRSDVLEALGAEVADLVESLPLPGDERLLERLVTLEPEARLAALAERLDHLRHAHLREDHAWWRAIHEEAGEVWVPVAERSHPRLADRYRHWHRTFRRRLERIGD